MESPEAIRNTMAHATGTDEYHRISIFSRRHVCTDGVRLMFEQAGAHWLGDLIVSHQPRAMRDPMLRDFQIWELEHTNGSRAVAKCLRDTDDVAFRQNIPYTDFPLPGGIKLYLERSGDNMVLMLPGER